MSPSSNPSDLFKCDPEELDWLLRAKLPINTQTHRPSSPAPPSSASILNHLHHPEPNHLQGNRKQPDNKEDESLGHVLSRSVSLPDENVTSGRKTGFLKTLFGKGKKTNATRAKSSLSPSPSPSPSPVPRTAPAAAAAAVPHDNTDMLKRTRSLSSNTPALLDPKLEEFFKHYKDRNADKQRADHDENSQQSTETNSIVSSTIQRQPASKPSAKTDSLGRPIPAHPNKSPLPPALVKNSHFARCVKDQLCHTNSQQAQQTNGTISSKLGFLRRNHSVTSSNLTSADASTIDFKHTHIPESTHQDDDIPGLENLPKLKRVAFDFPVFFNDPPQQIPSTNPRKGEVDVLPDGSIVIHKLTLAERKKLMAASQGGIVVGGSGPLKILTKEERDAIERQGIANNEKKEDGKSVDSNTVNKTVNNTTSESECESETDEKGRNIGQIHSIEAAASAVAATARGKEAPNELRRITTENEDEVGVSNEAKKINIDKPMARHNKSYVSVSNISLEDVEEKVNNRHVSIPSDVLYTRCCHLREILPIAATLKQLKPGSTDPISLLQLRNPKPSLVEVLTFSDFISVAPILCISLDGVSLTAEMLRIILSSLAHKKELEKLTLRNTPLDDLGWRLLCWFLTKNKTLSRLDLTQVPSLTTSVQKPPKVSAGTNLVRMECDPTSRSDMNWNLLNAVLISRNGIDEIVMNGANVSLPQFKNLMEMGIKLSTTKLGLAYNDLTSEHIEVLADNLDLEHLIGLDLAYNNLDGKLEYFNKRASLPGFAGSNLKFISLNSTSLTNKNEEVVSFLTRFVKLEGLRYLDLSNNKALFSNLTDTVAKKLPLFPRLSRIHLDYNDLSQSLIVMLAELIPFCESLSNISLIGSHLDRISGAALVSAMKKSHSVVTLDIEYDDLSSEARKEITFHTVKNMQSQLYDKDKDATNSGADEWDKLREELSYLLISEKTKPEPNLIKNFITKASNMRKKIHETIDELFNLRLQGKLSIDGKETLIRFCFIDSSIENGIKLLTHKSPNFDSEEVQNLGPSLRKSNPSKMGSYVTAKGHDELFPFGVSPRGELQDQENPEEIKDDGNRGRTADDMKLREEASILKLDSYFRDNNLRRNLSKEHLNTLKDMSGENYRDVLLKSSKLHDVTEVLDSLKEKGIPISDIITEQAHDDSLSGGNADSIDVETLKNTNSAVNGKKVFDLHGHKDDNVSDDSDDYTTDEEHRDDTSSSTKVDLSSDSDAAEKEGLGQAFDEILDELVRVRTNG